MCKEHLLDKNEQINIITNVIKQTTNIYRQLPDITRKLFFIDLTIYTFNKLEIHFITKWNSGFTTPETI